MANRNPPNNVNRAPVLGSLEQQNTWSFGIVGIVLYDFRSFYALDKFSYE